jgi:hypothetical protein
VNGEVPVKEAVVYRKITRADGSLVNQEWWRFGWQRNTWFAERLQPEAADSLKLVPIPNSVVCGASYTHVWSVSEKNIHVAAKDFGLGSKPDTYGGFQRNLMFSALSLGLPRRLDFPTLDDAQIGWNGLEFRTIVGNKHDQSGAVLSTSSLEGRLILRDDGLPRSAESPSIDGVSESSVLYEYESNTAGIPSIFTLKRRGWAYRYQFISCELGTNAVEQTGGFVPSQFADLKSAQYVTVWTNDKPYSVIDGNLRAAFGARIVGEKPKWNGLLILISLAVGAAIILTLWYRRSEREKRK